MRLVLSLLLVVSVVTAALVLPLASNPAPPFGPHAVREMHERLFAALDAGDVEAARAFYGAPNSQHEYNPSLLFLLDAQGRATTAEGKAAADALGRWAKERAAGGARWTSRITRSSFDCPSGDLSYGIFEIESKRPEGKGEAVQRLRVTSLVSWNSKTRDMTLFHMHVSKVD